MPPRSKLGTPLAPERALLHPSSWLALGVLGLNDHVFKGGDLLPGVVTGKLSDVAGLYVAPALFATVVRAKRLRTVVACHLAVGLVFATLELVPRAAELWSELFAFIGSSWRGWADPTDLLTLPVVAVAYYSLVPLMKQGEAESHRTAPPSRVELGVLAIGLGLCMASSPHLPPRHIVDGKLEADVFVHVPGNETDVSLHVSMPETPLDCRNLFRDPRDALRSVRFVPSLGGLVFDTQNQPISSRAGHGDSEAPPPCGALLVSASQSTLFDIGSDELKPVYVIWDRTRLQRRWIPERTENEAALPEGALILRETEHGLTLTARGPILIVPATAVNQSAQSR